MTDREKAIVMAYTGISMLVGDKFSIFHEYIEKICGRPIWTHQLAEKKVWNKIKEKSEPDFIQLCRETTETTKHGHWVKANSPCMEYYCSVCGFGCGYYDVNTYSITRYCPDCGAKMDGKENK